MKLAKLSTTPAAIALGVIGSFFSSRRSRFWARKQHFESRYPVAWFHLVRGWDSYGAVLLVILRGWFRPLSKLDL